MTPTTLGTLLLLLVAAPLAWWLGGSLGVGVLAGVLAAASVGVAMVIYQRRIAVQRPSWIIPAFALAFLVKLVVLVVLTAVFRFVDLLAARVDWRSFLMSYAAAAVVLLALGTTEAARALKGGNAP